MESPQFYNPEFVSIEGASNWIRDNELVITIIYNNDKRVYPLKILVRDEIVNDTMHESMS